MIPGEFAAIEARANAATEGPWHYCKSLNMVETVPEFDLDRFDITATGLARIEEDHADGEFIAHAREDIPALLAAVRERDNTIARVRAELARHEEYLPAAVDYDCCGYCNYTTGSYIAWPCPTYVHLRAALDPQETPDGRM